MTKVTNRRYAVNDPWMYENTFTIDPNEVGSAWERLSMNEWAYDFWQLPKIMHHSLIKTLGERRTLERSSG